MILRIAMVTAAIVFTQVLQAQIKDPFPYRFSESIYAQLAADSNKWDGGIACNDLSYIGRYKEVLALWDRLLNVPRQAVVDSMNFKETYHPVAAAAFLSGIAKEHQIIIINEAHYNPRNRSFVSTILPILKANGFRYFLAEGFAHNPGFKDNLRLPTLNGGVYLREPQFANLVRSANEAGFILYPYEDTLRSNGRDREINQAKNIAGLLKKDPEAKMLIYCGYDHILEDSLTTGSWGYAMAGRLKELTGIDPYTINQLVLAERSEKQRANPYWQLIDFNDYAFMVDKAGRVFNKMNRSGKVDALLYSPPTRYVHERPDWIFTNGKQPFFIPSDSVSVSYPFIAQVFSNEAELQELAVPSDIFEFSNSSALKHAALAADRGKGFIIRLIDSKGAVQLINFSRVGNR